MTGPALGVNVDTPCRPIRSLLAAMADDARAGAVHVISGCAGLGVPFGREAEVDPLVMRCTGMAVVAGRADVDQGRMGAMGACGIREVAAGWRLAVT